MAKDQTPPQPEPEINQEIKEIMGPPPEEAEPQGVAYKEPEDSSSAPTGPPEVESEASHDTDAITIAEPDSNAKQEPSEVSDVAAEINKQFVEQVESVPDTETVDQTDTLSDPSYDAAVSDIVVKESDDLLAAEDAKTIEPAPAKKTSRIARFFSTFWHSKRAKKIVAAVVIVGIVGLMVVPTTRYAILNTLGVRAGLSLKVVDSKSGIPIKNVEVSAGGQTGATDDNGSVSLSNVLLGKTQLVLAKRSFATTSQPIVIGWGSNPYTDPFQMTPTGSSYNFIVTDWLSDKPIAKAEVSDGESTAVTDDSGKATLIVQPTDKDLVLTIKAPDYRTQSITIATTDTSEKAVSLVAGKPEVFVSKRSGKFDVYKRDVDGTNETVLLPGNGNEQDPLGLLVHPDATVAAFVSSREGKRDVNGYLLSNLYMIDIAAKSVTKVPGTESAQIQLIDWVEDKLIFVKVAAGQSAATAGRQRIASYDYKQEKQTEIAAANYFNDIEVLKGKVYYAPSSAGSVIGDAAQLFRANTDGSAKATLLNKEVWTTYRVTYDKLQANAADNKWYEQNLGESKMNVMSGAPATPTHRIYVDAPNGEKTVWIDDRDGKGVLILQDLKASGDKVVLSKGGLGYPVRWLSDKHILVRVSNSQETADYVINLDGGEAQKIGDVTNTSPVNRWYYYR